MFPALNLSLLIYLILPMAGMRLKEKEIACCDKIVRARYWMVFCAEILAGGRDNV